jgi:ssRNA-specific RNase YbeY (16S rRNA maturation enzyme)
MNNLDLQIINKTKYQYDEKEIQKVVVSFFQFMKLPNMYVELIFVGEQRIHALNKQHRGVDKATDVLSFPIQGAGDREQGTGNILNAECRMDSTSSPQVQNAELWNFDYKQNSSRESYNLPPTTYNLALGSIIICPNIAKKRGESIIELVVHSLIHLIGYDHEKEKDNDQFVQISEKFWARF